MTPHAARADFSASSACFDTGPLPCVAFAPREPGDRVHWVLHVVNTGAAEARRLLVRVDAAALGERCAGGVDLDPSYPPECQPDPATCGAAACRTEVEERALLARVDRVPPGCAVALSLRAYVRQGTTGTCCAGARIEWEDDAGPGHGRSPVACFQSGLPDLVLAVELDPPAAAPRPGDAVGLKVTVTNDSASGALDRALLRTSLGSAGCLQVPDCASAIACDPPTSCGACRGDAAGLELELLDLPPKASVVLRVSATADRELRSTTVCPVTAVTADADPVEESSTVVVTVHGGSCLLRTAELAAAPGAAREMARLYARACEGGGDPVLGDALAEAGEGDLPDGWGGAPGALRLYQAECGALCPPLVGLVKNRSTGRVGLGLLP